MNNIVLFGVSLTPERLRQIVIVLAIGLFGYNVYSIVWPTVDSYLARRTQIDANQQKIDAARQLIGTRDQIENRLKQVKESLVQIQGRFPLRNQILSILLVDLSQIFRDTGTYMSSFEPLGFKPLEQGNLKNLGRMQIKIEARGDYPSVILLFDKLSRYERVLRIESPQIAPYTTTAAAPAAEGQGGAAAAPAVATPRSAFARQLAVSFSLTTYALNK
jgi:hypothetical protein